MSDTLPENPADAAWDIVTGTYRRHRTRHHDIVDCPSYDCPEHPEEPET